MKWQYCRMYPDEQPITKFFNMECSHLHMRISVHVCLCFCLELCFIFRALHASVDSILPYYGAKLTHVIIYHRSGPKTTATARCLGSQRSG